MGWDAFSSAKCDYKSKIFENPEIGKLFKEAAKFVAQKTGSVDGGLACGVLNVSACAYMLEQATDKSCWNEKGWSVKEVKQMQQFANWDFEYDKNEGWAYWSAKKFLEVCAAAKLSIRFSW